MARVNYETLGTLININDKDLEFERVTNSIDVVDREYGVEVIFDYYRRHGFPHYTIREEEKHDHLKKLRKFDIMKKIDHKNKQISVVLNEKCSFLSRFSL